MPDPRTKTPGPDTAHTDPLTIVVEAGDLPQPGEDVLTTSGAYEILIAHTGEPNLDVDTDVDTDADADAQIAYSVVDVHGATRVHAAVVRRRSIRSIVDRYPLCSRSRTRRVQRRRRDIDLTAVNCTQCRARLENEGIL